jgi:hypothetical protein
MIARRLRARTAVGLLPAAAMTTMWSACAVAASADGLRAEGRWTYTQRSTRNVIEYMATTPSAQDGDTWLLIACGADEHLTVAVIHTNDFRFPLAPVSQVPVRAAGLPDLSVTGKSIEAKQVVIDPRRMRHVMPILIETDQFALSIPERDGTLHEYTFMMQPNDRALAPLRALCLGSANDA